MLKEKVSKENCPKCRYGEIQSGICMRCGLIIHRYYEVQQRKKMISNEGDVADQLLSYRKRHLGGIGLFSTLLGVFLIFIVGVVLLANTLDAGRKDPEEMIDEIKQKVKAFQYDEARELARNYFGRDDQNTSYWSQFINEKEERNSNLQKGKRYFREGEILNRRRDFVGAAKKFEAALKNFQAYDDKKLIVATNLNLAISYRILLRNQDSLDNFEVASDISRKNGFREYEAKALQGCGLLYSHLGQYEKAITYLDEALTLHEVLEDRRGEAVDWLIKGYIKYNSNTPGAGNHFRKALAISKEIGDPVIELRADTLLNKWLNHPSEKATPGGSASQVENS